MRYSLLTLLALVITPALHAQPDKIDDSTVFGGLTYMTSRLDDESAAALIEQNMDSHAGADEIAAVVMFLRSVNQKVRGSLEEQQLMASACEPDASEETITRSFKNFDKATAKLWKRYYRGAVKTMPENLYLIVMENIKNSRRSMQLIKSSDHPDPQQLLQAMCSAMGAI